MTKSVTETKVDGKVVVRRVRVTGLNGALLFEVARHFPAGVTQLTVPHDLGTDAATKLANVLLDLLTGQDRA